MKGTATLTASGLLVFSLWLGACSQPPVKPTEDIERIQQIDGLLDDLRDKFQAKDLVALARFFSADRQGDINTLTGIMPSLDAPRLDFFIDRILLEQDTAAVVLHWEFRWDHSSEKTDGPKSKKHRGNAIFHLKGTQDLQLTAIEGDNPFLAPLTEQALPQ
jgi:hypothetical protein